MLPLGAPEGVLRAWSAPRLALTASFVSSTPRLPRSLLLKPLDCAGPAQSLGPSPVCGCSASAELGFDSLPAVAGTSCAIPPWHRVPRLGAQLSRCWGAIPPAWGPELPPAPSTPCVPPSCGVSRTPGSSSSLPGHPQLSRERARCVQLGHVASPKPRCPGPYPAP